MATIRPDKAGRGGRQRPWIAWALALAGSVAAISASCLFGPYPVAPGEVLAILGQGLAPGRGAEIPETAGVIVLHIRLSRAVLAWLVGAALGASGAVYQGILRNPLADPFTLGVSSGAAFGAALAIFLGLSLPVAGAMGISSLPLAAMAGGLAALAVVIALGRMDGALRRETLVLAGIVVATFLAALISLVKAMDEEAVGAIVFWIMGSLQGRGWTHVLLFLPYGAVGFALMLAFCRELDIISLGDTQAAQLGVRVGMVRLVLLVGASLAASAAVAVSGVIGFVGLVVPHLFRLVLGPGHRVLVPASAVGGGILLVFSDVLARTVAPGGSELPVGVVTALIGGPFFCFLLKGKIAEVRA